MSDIRTTYDYTMYIFLLRIYQLSQQHSLVFLLCKYQYGGRRVTLLLVFLLNYFFQVTLKNILKYNYTSLSIRLIKLLFVYGAVEVFLTSKLIQACAPVLTHDGRVSDSISLELMVAVAHGGCGKDVWAAIKS